MSNSDYIDRDGERWTYGPDINGDVGYHVSGGIRFPFEDDRLPHEKGMMSFEVARGYFGMVAVADLTPAHEAYRRLLRPNPAGTGNLVAVDRDDLELIFKGWEQWYRSRMDNDEEKG